MERALTLCLANHFFLLLFIWSYVLDHHEDLVITFTRNATRYKMGCYFKETISMYSNKIPRNLERKAEPQNPRCFLDITVFLSFSEQNQKTFSYFFQQIANAFVIMYNSLLFSVFNCFCHVDQNILYGSRLNCFNLYNI